MTSHDSTAVCTGCGAHLQSSDRFCVECGAACRPTPTVPSAGGTPGVPRIRLRTPAAGAAAAPAGPGTPPQAATPAPSPPPHDPLLERLRRAAVGYDVAGVLGRGGMAIVYLAHHMGLDRDVAIKVLSPTLMMEEGAVARFKREAKTAARLEHHQHIVQIYETADTGDLVYFTMQYVPGGGLDSALHRVGPLPASLVIVILSQVGSALATAHGQGIVHRDVKPGNILLHDKGYVMLSDFGIAKVTQARNLTMTGATVGTPIYMSPEQCLGHEETTAASDQYALGVVAYEMLTGRPPFERGSLYELMQAHLNEPPPPLGERRPDCAPVVAEAIMRMLAKRPEERWPSMEDALTAITGCADPLRGTRGERGQLSQWAQDYLDTRPIARSPTPMSPVPVTRPGASAAPEAPPSRRE